MGLRVMIVEDEPVVAVGIRSMIEDSGHEVVAMARSGEEALSLLDEARPDVAVVDVKLPGMDGIETTRNLVQRADMGVVILTAYSDPEFIEGSTAAGAFTYLLKPVTKEALAANVCIAAKRAVEFAELRKEAADTKTALEVRKLTERAKSILMERASLGEAAAHSHLTLKCRNQNKTMRQVAEEIIAADKAFMSTICKDPDRDSDGNSA
jgi:response regulator NasT